MAAKAIDISAEPVELLELVAGTAVEVPGAVANVAALTWESGMRSDEQDAEFVGGRAQEFVKVAKTPAQKVYEFAGGHWEGCSASPGRGASVGIPIFGVSAVPGAIGGGVVRCGAVVGTEVLAEAALWAVTIV